MMTSAITQATHQGLPGALNRREGGMNIELKPRIDSFSVLAPARIDSLSVPAPANDNAERERKYAQPRRRAVIYKPAKSAMTSGRRGTNRWLLEFDPQSAPFIEPLMGWTGSTDPMAHMQLSFPTREAAVAYARRAGLDYEVRKTTQSKKPDAAAAKPQAQPAQWMTLWPIGVSDSEWSDLVVGGIGAIACARHVAA